jgi:hemerythrin-like domain-containing protein
MNTPSLRIIHDEHRALAAMLSSLRALAQGYESGRLKPDFNLLSSMIDYIEQVPEKVHHPKETEYLFTRLRACCPEAIPVLDALDDEHRHGHARIEVLRAALQRYERDGTAGFALFHEALKAYLDQEWRHMNTEEKQVFPLAQAHLTAEDWQAIDAVFLANGNPWEGAAGEYAALFSRIVHLAPAPVGLGG